jgi:hypothetical protein
MKAPRSVTRVFPDGGREYLSVAVRVTAAPPGKDGFFVQIFPDQRGPQAIYLSGAQLEHLIQFAESSGTEAELWAELAKIPLEPLAPARSLYGRLRNVLVDARDDLRDEIAAQRAESEARARARAAAEVVREPEPAAATEEPPRPVRDPDAL